VWFAAAVAAYPRPRRKTMSTTRTLARTAVAGALLAALAPAAAEAHEGHEGHESHEEVAAAQANGVATAVARAIVGYRDPQVAQAAGFVRMPGCVDGPEGAGTMGEHWVRFDRIDDVVRITEPEVLLYLPDATGGFRLVGAEYVSIDAEDALAGVPLGEGPEGLGALHVWTETNPAGTFAPFNPALSCPTGS
jgi:hypothetical protein